MKKALLMILGFLLLTSFISAHVSDDDFGHHDMMTSYSSYSYFGGIRSFGGLCMILIILALVLLIIWSIKQVQKKPDLKGLDKDEKRVIDLLLKENKAMFQATLKEKLGVGKVKLTRLLDKLEAKQIIERKRRGMNNIVVLKD